MGDDKGWGLVVLACCFITCMCSVVVTKSINDRCWTNSALEHNAAHYDIKTGVFQWNE